MHVVEISRTFDAKFFLDLFYVCFRKAGLVRQAQFDPEKNIFVILVEAHAICLGVNVTCNLAAKQAFELIAVLSFRHFENQF